MEKGRFSYAGESDARRKPAGGFVFISGTAILSVWWAYKRRFVTLLDLRVWLGCFEVMARRCGLQRGRLPQYTVRELTVLVGSNSESSVRRSISRLRRYGLLGWSESRMKVGHPLPTPSIEDQDDEFTAFLEQVPNHSRRIPVPRRVIRMLAKDGNKVLTATVLGHLLRCLYYRMGACRPAGTCKASWIAETFGVDARNVKAARKALVATGLLKVEARSQRFLNRYGSLVTVNLSWEAGSARCPSLPPPRSEVRRSLPPPNKEPELLRSKNQKPPSAAAGACTAGKTLCPPNLRHVVPADLVDPGRLAILHEQARKAGYVNGSEADRLKFFAAAEHARVTATRNPAGLFAATVRQRRWSFLTLADEDVARQRLTITQTSASVHIQRLTSSRPTPVGSLIRTLMNTLWVPCSGS